MKFGIIGAMDSEVATLIASMEEQGRDEIAACTFVWGRIGDQDVVVVKSGIGKVCAALCAQILIDRFAVDAIVNTGIAGGLHSSLAVGDLVVADAAVQHDFDLTAFGHVNGYMPALGGDDRLPSFWQTDPALEERFIHAAETVKAEQGLSFRCLGGVVASGDVFVSDGALKQTLVERFNAAAAEMEGAAVAQVAALNGVPCAIIRAISDLADGSAAASFEDFEQQAADLVSAILLTMLREM